MAPLFVVRAVIDRSSRRIVMAVVTTGALLVQLGVYVHSQQTATGVAASRVGIPGVGAVVSDIAMRQFVPLVAGQSGSARLDESGAALHYGLGAAIAVGVGVLLLALIVDSTRRMTAALLVGVLVIVETFVFVGALGSRVDSRYTVVPLGILTLALLFGAATAKHRPLRLTAVAVSGVVLLAGLGQFWVHRPTELRCDGCPEWRTELAAWRADPSHRPDVWPYDREEVWAVNLGEVGHRRRSWGSAPTAPDGRTGHVDEQPAGGGGLEDELEAALGPRRSALELVVPAPSQVSAPRPRRRIELGVQLVVHRRQRAGVAPESIRLGVGLVGHDAPPPVGRQAGSLVHLGIAVSGGDGRAELGRRGPASGPQDLRSATVEVLHQ
jgi:hypothetical protein